MSFDLIWIAVVIILGLYVALLVYFGTAATFKQRTSNIICKESANRIVWEIPLLITSYRFHPFTWMCDFVVPF